MFPSSRECSPGATWLSVVLKGSIASGCELDPLILEAHFRLPDGTRRLWSCGSDTAPTYGQLRGDQRIARGLLREADLLTDPRTTKKVSTFEAQSLTEVLKWAEWIRVNTGPAEMWFRGQAAKSWSLITKLSRSPANRECDILDHFRRGAPSRTTKHYVTASHLQLMSLAQHYGAPTRLLDWSQSLLVALYFAVNGQTRKGTDAVIAVLIPAQLNRHKGLVGALPTDGSGNVDVLAEQSMSSERSSAGEVLAFRPTQVDERQRIQCGVFTLHATSLSLEEHPDASDAVYKITVAASAIEQIKADLEELFAITRGYLFPDWQGLGDEAAAYGRSRTRTALTNLFIGHPLRHPFDQRWVKDAT